MEYYFTNLDFPEIAGEFPYNHHHLGEIGRFGRSQFDLEGFHHDLCRWWNFFTERFT